MAETVLVLGATGIIGVSVAKAALNTGRNVLAVVRSQDSADKMFKHLGTREGVTTVEADVLAEDGIEVVLQKVKAGELPAFQHVYSTVGTMNWTSPMQDLTTAAFREVMNINLEANFFAYRATVPHLIEQGNPKSTWTLITGGAGELGLAGVTCISQGALFSMANAASVENENTNVRFNEVMLCYRVEYDQVAEEKGAKDCIAASDFARVYEGILKDEEIKGCRVRVYGPPDLDKLKFDLKVPKKWGA